MTWSAFGLPDGRDQAVLKGTPNRMLRLVVLIVLILSCVGPVLARNQGQYVQTSPEIRDWIRGLKDKNGNGCCSTADGYPAEVEWDTERERYRVRIGGQWYVVPPEAVIDGPNKLGYAVVWYVYDDEQGTMKIRCFIAGAGG